MSRRSRRRSQNETCGIIGMVGGIFMIIAGVTGAVTWRRIGELAVDITGVEALGPAFQILVALGGLGGILVILGSIFIGWPIIRIRTKNRLNIGKLMITIGAGFGLLGLLIFLLLTMLGGDPFGNFMGALGMGFVGLICSIYAVQKSH
ncbi:MAG: hypothetical protein KKH41_08430 [Candidatus Thermoplasmatota archaeon]|nr:hypothetical protein [Euryarchaeota archaeon]MBU4032318.1 hypothetical protein [Candidatus Thermoplasmatota archaeon]MBU4070933.1 hypothetical protein [Candidatus Thermoplasmatota archaeon]MBU4144319.1 hypothetical protein [Candidatus Thermoplasmatota archaeon]MBU4592591.1 hypothetical protein [Candidatus Thermoplasmatota archaeon]